MSELKSFNTMKARFGFDKLSNWGVLEQKKFPNTMGDKVDVRGKEKFDYANPLVRIREDKLRSMKRALYNSYQSAIIQFDKDDREYHFRCLINHDKLKVDYEDKVLSIPFREVPVELEKSEGSIGEKVVDTGTPGAFLDEMGNPVVDEEGHIITQYRVKTGDTFKWVSGNEGYMPDSYWIIFLQYSEETAYFRGEIRKADDEIQIIPIEEDGSEGEPVLYHGWTTGPNEDDAIWNVKKGVVWNDLYYSKILYITKDETTEAFFKRFDRVIVNGQTWEIQGYNDNYGTSSKNVQGGMIRVALKQTYTSTNEVIKDMIQEEEEKAAIIDESISGPIEVQSYDVVKYYSTHGSQEWSVPDYAPVDILSNDPFELKLEIGQVFSKTQFTIHYGDQELKVAVQPFK